MMSETKSLEEQITIYADKHNLRQTVYQLESANDEALAAKKSDIHEAMIRTAAANPEEWTKHIREVRREKFEHSL